MKSTICLAEDRESCEPCLKLLLLSLNAHIPGTPINLFYPPAKDGFLAWIKKCPEVRLQTEQLKDGSGWNVKPQAILNLIDQGFDEVIWIDSDVVVNRNIFPLLSDLKSDTFVATEHTLADERCDANALRARLWGLPVGRVLPFALNSGVLRVTRAHHQLMDRWWKLLQSDIYQDFQKKTWLERPIHMQGDQDVLTALLTSKEFSEIPIHILRRGKHILQFDGVYGYTLAERLGNLPSGCPAFVHSVAGKPWSDPWQLEPGGGLREYIKKVYLDLSPYTLSALRYKHEMGSGTEWMRPHYALSRVLRVLGMWYPPLVGLPMAFFADIGRLAKYIRKSGRTSFSQLKTSELEPGGRPALPIDARIGFFDQQENARVEDQPGYGEALLGRKTSDEDLHLGDRVEATTKHREAEGQAAEHNRGLQEPQADNGPLVSILIPAYNANKWLAATIRSAIAQTWKRKEIIVVDDGSTDQTLTIARQFESESVRVLSQKNQGAAAARNHALQLSQGDYIQWLDSDDLLAPDKIERQLAALREGDSKRILLSSPWARFYYRTRQAPFVPSSLWQDLSPVEWLLRKMGENLYMQPATWLTSRELALAAGPWDTRLWYDDDGEYFCRVLLASEGTRFVPGTGIFYRITGVNSISYMGRSDRKRDALLLSVKLHIQYLRSLEDSDRVRKACLEYLRTKCVDIYPERPDIFKELQSLAGQLQGRLEVPRLRWKYAWMKPVFGRKAAKWAQVGLPHMKISLVRHFDRALFEWEGREEALSYTTPLRASLKGTSRDHA